MAIKFEDEGPDRKSVKKEVGGKAYVAEEPAPGPATPETPETPETPLPFAKPVRPDKKPRKPMR